MALYRLGTSKPKTPEEGFYWVAPTAVVIGSVLLGRDVSVWFGAVVRGDNETIRIGDGTNVQDNAVLHSDPGYPLQIGQGCTIGHSAIVHGCIIDENTMIGIGATVLNGATIGKNCLVGANALVTEGTVIPDNSLALGQPAKPIRQLNGETIKSLEDSAKSYVRNWRRFAAELAQPG